MKRRSLVIVVGGAFLMLVLGMGLRQSLGLFLQPISLDLKVGREVFGFAFAVQNLIWGLASPIAGGIADRYGPGRVGAVGGIFYAAGLLWMAFATDGLGLTLSNFLIGLGMGAAGFAVVIGAVARAAPPEKRSTALGIVTAGGSIGQFAMVPIAHGLIDGLGWVVALVAMAGMTVALVPLSASIAGITAASHGSGAPQSLGHALREARKHRGFILLTIGFFVCGFHLAFVTAHLPAYLADKAMPAWLGAAALSLVGLFNAVGSFTCGRLGDRWPKNYLLSWVYGLRSVVFLGFLIFPVSEASVLIFAAALGLLWLGTIPLTSGLIASIFGPAYLSMLYGITFVGHQLGSFMSAWLGGYVYDATGSYDAVWWTSVVLGLAAALIHLPIAERPVERLRVQRA